MITDWQWQMRNTLKSHSVLATHLDLTTDESAALSSLEKSGEGLPFLLTPHYFSLIDLKNPADPLRRQIVPTLAEFKKVDIERRDPLGEEDHEVVPHLVHRYPDRVLLLLTDRCASYCRFCTRKRWVGQGPSPKADDLDQALNYIAEHPEIKEVIISGGDPLMVSDQRLKTVLQRIRAISSVEIIRIGSRMLTFAPQRITPELIQVLQSLQPLYLMAHFNHPHEISSQTESALTALANAGIPVFNQTVLLKDVNDSAPVLEKLFRKLVRLRVRLYYLHQCDLAPGVEQFRVPLAQSLAIMKALQGRVSGLCMPKFVIDIPGGFGKVPLTPDSIVARNEDEIILEGFAGERASYPLV